jgi:hypothetical protein
MAEAELIMERPLAMRLLHEAQIAENEVMGVVTASATADRYYAGDWMTASQRATRDGRKPWAVFAFKPGHYDPPSQGDFDGSPGLFRITACLETKGVLQLRIFRRLAEKVEECPLTIVD